MVCDGRLFTAANTTSTWVAETDAWNTELHRWLRSPPCRDVRIVLVEMNYYRHRHRYGRPATVVVVCNGIRVTRGWFGRACNDASRACVESRMCSTKLGLGSCEAYDSGKRLVASQ